MSEGKRVLVGILALMTLFALIYFSLFTRTGLPTDEEMIGYFERHRTEFNQVVQGYRSFERPEKVSRNMWRKQPGMPELLNRTSIDYVQPNVRGELFIPKEEVAAQGWSKASDYLSSKDPTKFFHRYGTLMVSLSPREKYFRGNWRYGFVWKKFVNFPVPPPVYDGEIYWQSLSARTADSLDVIPNDWEVGECVYKAIDTNWYLALCNGH